METTYKGFLARGEGGDYYEVFEEKGGRYIGLIRYVKRGRWYFSTRRGSDGFVASKNVAKAVVVNEMRKSTTKECA